MNTETESNTFNQQKLDKLTEQINQQLLKMHGEKYKNSLDNYLLQKILKKNSGQKKDLIMKNVNQVLNIQPLQRHDYQYFKYEQQNSTREQKKKVIDFYRKAAYKNEKVSQIEKNYLDKTHSVDRIRQKRISNIQCIKFDNQNHFQIMNVQESSKNRMIAKLQGVFLDNQFQEMKAKVQRNIRDR